MKKHQICIMLSDMQYEHFRSLLESEGCESVTEMFRKCVFGHWPIKKQPSATSSKAVSTAKSTMSQHGHNHAATMSEHGHNHAATMSEHGKEAEQESFPHTPFKEYNNNKNISNACAREEKPKKPKSAEPKFVPPTLDEVREYIAAKGYTFDAEHFWSFYTAKGWRVGSHVMKSWHAACTTWQKNSDQRNKTEAIRQAHIDARFEKRNAAASASSNSRYYNGRLKLSNHVDISEEERNDLLKDFFA